MASSMNEAGYFALSRTAQETLWWHQLLKQFDEQLQVVPATTEAHDSTAKKSTFEEAMRVASAARAGLPVQIFRRNHLDGTVDWFPDRSIPFSRVNWSSTRRRWDFNRCSLRNRQARLRLKPELIIQALMHRLVIYSMVDCWRNRLLLCAVPVRIFLNSCEQNFLHSWDFSSNPPGDSTEIPRDFFIKFSWWII